MRQSLCPLVRPEERLQPLLKSFHLYHNRPINKTAKFRRERDAKARNSIVLAHSGCAPRPPLRHPGRRTCSRPLWGTLTPTIYCRPFAPLVLRRSLAPPVSPPINFSHTDSL